MADDYDFKVGLLQTAPNPDLLRIEYEEKGILVRAHIGESGRRLENQGYLEYVPNNFDPEIQNLANRDYRITAKGKSFIKDNYYVYKGFKCAFCKIGYGDRER